jgi:hypothetical protein
MTGPLITIQAIDCISMLIDIWKVSTRSQNRMRVYQTDLNT